MNVPQPVAVIQIALFPDGSLQAGCQGPANTVMIRGMLDEAKDRLLQALKDQAAGGIEVAPPGAVNRLNGKL